jgi:hypothetical protein
MSIKNLFPSLFMVLATTVLSAAEPETNPQTTPPDQVAATNPAETTEPVIPKRGLKFDASEEEVPLPLENVQEGMLDQRYVATFLLADLEARMPTSTIGGMSSSGNLPLPWDMNKIDMPRYQNLRYFLRNNSGLLDSKDFSPKRNPMDEVYDIFRRPEGLREALLTGRGVFYKAQKGIYAELAAKLPEKQRLPLLPRDRNAAFTSESPPFIQLQPYRSPDGTRNPNIIEVHLLAPSDKQAKQWVEEWLDLYDWGLCYPAQKECLKLRKKLDLMLAENSDKIKEAESDFADSKQELAKYKDFDDIKAEAIVTLTTQRRMLAVDLAGIKARINTCEEMLTQKNLPAGRKDQIETTLVAAQIELHGLDAKQAEIDRIIQGAQSRQKLLFKTNSYSASVQTLKSSSEKIQTANQELDEYQLGYQPLPVEDGKVTIRRIKWISPPKKEKTNPDSTSK